MAQILNIKVKDTKILEENTGVNLPGLSLAATSNTQYQKKK
jgi:hypothetical protein